MMEHKKSSIVNTINDFSYALVSELRPVPAVKPNYAKQETFLKVYFVFIWLRKCVSELVT